MKFEELNVNEHIKKSLAKLGYTDMMPIQEKAIPVVLEGNNVIGEAATGTGKTLAFALPILNMLDYEKKDPQALILAPTRELAIQIDNEIHKIDKKVKTAVLVGGMSIRQQQDELRMKPQIIVGTIGRVIDQLKSKKFVLDNTDFFVLDEADEMLKEGFIEEIEYLNDLMINKKQTLLFSATISPTIKKLTKKIMDDYEHIAVETDTSNPNIEQCYVVTKEKNKFTILTKFLDIQQPTSAIVFGRTKRRADELNKALQECGYNSVAIHGDLSQDQRNRVMKDFRDKKINVLVATDVAARGLDISGVSHVYNFDLPQEIEFYIHRIGRTGRAHDKGISISFIRDTEFDHIRRIEEVTNIPVKEIPVPSFADVRKTKYSNIKETIEQKLNEIDLSMTSEFASELIETYGAEKIISIYIESQIYNHAIKDIVLTGEPPVKTKKSKNDRGRRNNFNDNRSRSRSRDRDSRNRDRDNNRSRGSFSRDRDNNRSRGNNSSKGSSYNRDKNFRDGGNRPSRTNRTNKKSAD